MNVTPAQLIATLEGTGNLGAKIATIITRTHPKLLVKHRITCEPCPYLTGDFVHIAHKRVTLGADYGAAVNRERTAEGATPDFNPEQLWKGAGRKHGAYTVYHRESGQLYFPYKPRTDADTNRPVNIRAGYFHNGMEVTGTALIDLANYLPLPGKADKQGVDKIIHWRTVEIENVVALAYGETVYDVDHTVPANVTHCPVRA